MKRFIDLEFNGIKHSPSSPNKDFIKYCVGLNTENVSETIEKDRQEIISVTERKSASYVAYAVFCKGTGCVSSGEPKLKDRFVEELKKRNLEDKVYIVESGCKGFCEMGPLVSIFPNEAFYCQVSADDVSEIIEQHITNGKIVERLLFDKCCQKEEDIDFYKKQVRRVLGNAGQIDPENIDEYIANEGYLGLTKAIFEKSPDEVIQEVLDSGLRGRGGGGFLTGKKWQLCKQSEGDTKYVVCNADEGDPGAFMDRSILEADPHKVIEGMTIAAYSIGSSYGFIYVRAEYPLAVKRISIALEQAREYGLLGENILGSDFSFDLEICQGAGAFVCGEETALISSIEGKRGIPSVKPPFPTTSGVFGKPTNVNNVETYANVPLILNKGADWFSAIGTDGSKGTKIFALTGKVLHTGLVEVPMGISLRDIIFGIGGGLIGGANFKAAQTGGPSGGCIPEDLLDLQIDFDSLKEIGAMMGSGGLVIMDEHTCMVDLAKFFLNFTQHESCGKCIPCREGTKRMLEILERITEGRTEDLEDIDRLNTLSTVTIKTAACGLGQSAPNPILSTLKYFHEEYVQHIKDKKCKAGVCKNFVSYYITEKCIGCGACKRVCPVDCISGERKEQHLIDQEKCIKCGSCQAKCKFNAIEIR